MMNQTRIPLSRVTTAVVATVLALCSAAPALAAGKADTSEAAARYKKELAACNDGQTNQARATCITEAKNAYADAKRGQLSDGNAVDPANAAKRCDVQRGDDRTACLARMQGQGSTSGSAAQGGVLRELVTREPAPAAPETPPSTPVTSGTTPTPQPAPAVKANPAPTN